MGLSDSEILIPKPPEREERISELDLIADQYYKRYNPPEHQHKLDSDVVGLFNSLVKSSGRSCIIPMLEELNPAIKPIILVHKEHFNQGRPADLAYEIGKPVPFDYLESAQTPSYPSGHAAQAFFFAHLLSDLFPDLSINLYELANMVAESRVDRGVHFPSDISAGKLLARKLYDSTRSTAVSSISEGSLAKVRGYMKPEDSFFTLDEWQVAVEALLALQEEGIDVRGSLHPDPRLSAILQSYFGYQLDIEVDRWDLLTDKNVLDFIEDFSNHRFWGLKKEFGHYFPDINKLRFAYFYSRGDMEPYVLLDDEFTTQLYGSVNNPKELMHYTTTAGVQKITESLAGGLKFDISTFTVAKRPFFRAESNIILKILGNVRAGFRSDIKSMAIDNGRKACNLYRLEYPGEDLNNICYELDSCDGDIRTSLWNEYIATPIEILEVMELKL